MSAPEEYDALLSHMAENPETSGDQDDDSDAMMQAAMGFSDFGGTNKPKRQPRGPGSHGGFGTGANSEPIQQRVPSVTSSSSKEATPSIPASTLSARSHPFIPASLPPRPVSSASSSVDPGLNLQDSHSATPNYQENGDSDIPLIPFRDFARDHSIDASPLPSPTMSDPVVYTHPVTQVSFKRSELRAYELGVMTNVMNNEGVSGPVKVYFKPSFVEDDPWEGL